MYVVTPKKSIMLDFGLFPFCSPVFFIGRPSKAVMMTAKIIQHIRYLAMHVNLKVDDFWV